MKNVKKLEMLTVLLSVQGLLESGDIDKAKELVAELIEEIRRN